MAHFGTFVLTHTHTDKRDTHTHTHAVASQFFDHCSLIERYIYLLPPLRMSLCAFNLDFCVSKIRTHTYTTNKTHSHTHTHVHAAYSRLCVLKQKSFRRCVRFSFVSLHARVVSMCVWCVCLCMCVSLFASLLYTFIKLPIYNLFII